MCKINSNTKLISLKQPVYFLHDEPYVRYASKVLKHNVIFIDILSKQFYRNLDAFINNFDQPLSLYNCYYALAALSLKAKQFGKVLFTGCGGDELFLGYGNLNDWFSDEKENYDKLDILSGPMWSAPYSNYFKKTIIYGLVGYSFVQIDKAITENQMEDRCPYLDWNLMNFVRKIPAEYWKRNNVEKYPLKKLLLKKGFSERFVFRKKCHFRFPFKYIMILKYPYIVKYLNANLNKIETFGLRTKNLSPAGLFNDFNLYWRIFIFLKFFEFNKEMIKKGG